MGQFIHSNGQIVIIDGSGNQSIYEESWWVTEETEYTLPIDALLQYYRQGEVHAYHTATEAKILTIPWTDGDAYISKKPMYDADYQLYLDLAKPLQQLKDEKKVAVDAYSSTVKLGGVVYDGNTYPTDGKSFDRIFNQHAKYTRDLGVPVGHYVLDILGVHQELVLVEHEDLLDVIIDMYTLCDVNSDAHKEAVQALTTKEDVLAYDYSTGWITVPYNP